MPRLTRGVFEAAAIATALAILGVMAFRLAQADGLLLANGQPVFGDFIAFWSGGRVALEQGAAHVHDHAAVMAQHRNAMPGIHVLAPWNYPPTFLLIASALALLPYPVAALLFLGLTGALYLFAARKLLPDARALMFAVTAPAAIFHLGSIQTGLFIAGVTALALHWLDRRPLTAGALVALLAIKPHLAIVWPIYLALSGRWRAFTAAAFATILFVAVAGFAFGFESYPRFIANLAATQDLVDHQRVPVETFASLYGNLLGLGAVHGVAMIAQAISAILALALAALAFRKGDSAAQGAALCAATALITPYFFFYDATLLCVGAALLAPGRDRFELAALAAAWGAGLSLPLGHVVTLPLCPLAAWLLLLAAARRARGAPYPTRTAPDPARSEQSSPPAAA